MIKNIFKVLPLLLIAFVLFTSDAKAVGSVSLNGYAWSDTIGWVSFNGTDGGNVTLSTTTPTAGTIAGYAWSDNIGWISFQNGDINHPNPSVNLGTGAVSGWARACAGTENGDCISSDRADGWDGWIELSGTNHTSPTIDGTGGVTFNSSTGRFNGYAWGSDVVGWLTFDSGIAGTPVSCEPNCGGGPTSSLIGVCSTAPSTTGVTWSIQNVSGGTSPYQWKWNGGASTTNSFTSTGAYGVTINGPSVIVGSSDGQVISPMCSPGTVVDPTNCIPGDPGCPTSAGTMWLNDISTLTTLKTTVNKTVKVNWNIGTATGCTATKNTTADATIINDFNNLAVSTNGSIITPALKKGVYDLSISCTDGGSPNPVQIIVTDSSIHEN